MAKKKAARKTRRKATRGAMRSAAGTKSPEKKKTGRGGVRPGAGKPPFKPTEADRRNVETLVGIGLRHEEIALLVVNPKTGRPIDEKTLRRHFRRELETGAHKANAQVAQSLYRKATGDGPQAVTAGIWWTKCRMGWKERVVAEVEVKSGVLVPPAAMTPEQWIEAVAKRAAEAKEPGAEGEEGE